METEITEELTLAAYLAVEAVVPVVLAEMVWVMLAEAVPEKLYSAYRGQVAVVAVPVRLGQLALA
jgi:hypothetical protein